MYDSRISITLLCNVLLFFIIDQLNAWLLPWQLHLNLDSLYLIFICLYFRLYSGLAVAVFSGALAYAGLPGWEGGLVIWTAAFLLGLQCREYVHRDNPLQVVLLALAGNLFIFLALTLSTGSPLWSSWAWWLSLLTDLILSEGLVLLVVLPWISLQRRILLFSGIDLAAEMQSL